MKVPTEIKKRNNNAVRIGLEFENPIVNLDGSNIHAKDLQNIFLKLINVGWVGETERISGNILELKKTFDNNVVNISTDCAWSSIEFSLPPTDTLEQSEHLHNVVIKEVSSVIRQLGFRLLGLGSIPGKIDSSNLSKTTKPFYKTLTYLHFHNLNLAINAHQVNIDVSFDKAIQAVNDLIQISGLITAVSANCSINNFSVLPWKDWRILSWKLFPVTDYPKTKEILGFPEKPFRSMSDYFARYMSINPMFITPIRKTSTKVDEGLSWLNYLKSKSVNGKNLFGEVIEIIPESSDINIALLNQWPYAKLHIVVDPKNINVADFISAIENNILEDYLSSRTTNIYIELRIASTSPKGEELAIPALFFGLMNNFEALHNFVGQNSWEVWKDFLDHAAIYGLSAKIGGLNCSNLIKELISIAKFGLEKKQEKKSLYLNILSQRIQNNHCPADVMNELLNKKGIKTFIEDISY